MNEHKTEPPSVIWRCFGGHDARGGPNYCVDIHAGLRKDGTGIIIGPLCASCYDAHRETAHRHERSL